MANHAQQLGALHADEAHARLVGHRLGQQRLPTAGRSTEEDALGSGGAKLLEVLGVLDWVLENA
jgi:hypothetical protein